MPLFFNIDDKQRFHVEVMVGQDLYTKSLSEIIACVTADSKRIKQVYTDFKLKEGGIHGQGRVQLIEGLDDLFGVLLLLRQNLTERAPREVSSIMKLVRRVTIDVKINKFMAKGTLVNNEISNLESFNAGYDVLVVKRIKDLLLKYKNTLNSEELLLDDYMDLYNTFAEIFHNIILIRYAVENLLLDK
jgi:hypothetical protein